MGNRDEQEDAVEVLLRRMENMIEGVRDGTIGIKEWRYTMEDNAWAGSYRTINGMIEWVELIPR